MKYLWILLLIPMLASADVELLVKAQEHWRDGKPTVGWTAKKFKDFWRQPHKGEIIAITDSGKTFGTMDVPPVFVHITVQGVTKEQALQYMQPITEGYSDTIMVKERRFHFTRAAVDSALALWDADSSRLVLTKSQAASLIKEYDINAIKQKIQDRLQR